MVGQCDDEIKEKIQEKCEVYKRIVRGEKDLWEEYNMLRREVKHLLVEKKLNVSNEVVEKAHSDFESNRKEFWAFVGRRRKV